MIPVNPYQYSKPELKTITNEKLALCQGWQESFITLVVWLEEPCTEHDEPRSFRHHRKDCPQCWQELKESVK